MNKKLIAGFIIAIAAMPLAASALSIDEIQAKIKELLSQVSSLQMQLKDAKQAEEPKDDHEENKMNRRICSIPVLRALVAGQSGDEVKRLQEFLKEEGILNAEATGYFGSQTRAALGKWQIENNVVTKADANIGWGTLGPRTRSIINEHCKNPNSARFQAKPQSGSAPLEVSFTSNLVPVGQYAYIIDFGDGSTGDMNEVRCFADSEACNQALFMTAKHTYSSDGTYTAILYQNNSGGCTPEAEAQGCLGSPASKRAIAKVQIRVGDTPVACTKEYKPVCGSKPIVCITTPCNPIQQTYSNACMMRADGANFIHEGVCRDDNSNRPPSISSFSGPTSLNINEIGTWKVTATDPENGNLSYSIQWGDEWYGRDAAMTSFPPSSSIQQQTTFTHSYASSGSHTVRITVRDDAGKQAVSTATVQVGTTAYCTKEYVPVCGRPACPGDPNLCGISAPQTYSNRCMLNAANAMLIHSGACNSTDQ